MIPALDAIVCTAPWTVEDSRRMYEFVKGLATDASADVKGTNIKNVYPSVIIDVKCNDGKHVELEVRLCNQRIVRVYEVR